MDIVQWLPGLTGIAAIGAAAITSLTAIRTTAQTARLSLHTTYTTPRLKAITDFLAAVENGRNDPTPENLNKTQTVYLTLRVLAFEETSQAKDVRNRAHALTDNLRAMVENLPHLPLTPAEVTRKDWESAASMSEAQDQAYRDAGADMTSKSAKDASDPTDDLRYALNLVDGIHDRGGSATEEERGQLSHFRSSLGRDLNEIVEIPSERAQRLKGRAEYSKAEKRLGEDRHDFAKAVAHWLNVGPQ